MSTGWPRTFWPGAVCNDWFGVIAFYTTALGLVLLSGLVITTYVWLGRKLWRMKFRGEDWWA